jgi:restriction system protein
MITTGYEIIQETLYNELLEKVKTVSDQGFEMLVLDLCKKMNYGDLVEHTGKSGDQGIDGIIKEDRLGLGEIYLQAKRWEGQVPSKEVRNFVGSLQATKTKKGIFITTSDFTPDGRDFAKRLSDTTIILINGKELARLMVEYDVGVSEVNNIKIKKIDQDYFDQYI